jgi:hypothetical protein
MSTRCFWTPTLLVLCALTACASTPPAQSRANVTGSRIAVPVDSQTGLPEANPALQVVSQDQIRLTGQTDVGTALRMLVPALH